MFIFSPRSRKHIASITLMAFFATQFGWLSVLPTYALMSTYTAIQTQASANPTASVTTFTVDVAGVSSDTIMLDGCTIMLMDF